MRSTPEAQPRGRIFTKTITTPDSACKPENALSRIPVIASQVGYSGIDGCWHAGAKCQRRSEADEFPECVEFKAWNGTTRPEDDRKSSVELAKGGILP